MVSHVRDLDEGVDIQEVVSILVRGWKTLLVSVGLFLVVSVIVAVSLPDVYRATVLMAPSKDSKGAGLSALAGQFGGLASLAGINFSGAELDGTVVTLEIMKSRRFLLRFIEQHEILVPLFAGSGWDAKTGALTIDEGIYSDGKWVRDVSFPSLPKPSEWEAYKEFRKIFTIATDKKTGLVSISIDSYSPFVAQQWSEMIVHDINEYMRKKDVEEADKNIQYLNEQLGGTSVFEMEKIFYQLIEEQTKTMMLAEVRAEYAFEVIDPSVVPEERNRPKRLLIVIVGIMLGGVFGVIIIAIKNVTILKS